MLWLRELITWYLSVPGALLLVQQGFGPSDAVVGIWKPPKLSNRRYGRQRLAGEPPAVPASIDLRAPLALNSAGVSQDTQCPRLIPLWRPNLTLRRRWNSYLQAAQNWPLAQAKPHPLHNSFAGAFAGRRTNWSRLFCNGPSFHGKPLDGWFLRG